MLKEFQRESKEIVEKIYEISPPLKIFYLIRKRKRGLIDINLEKATTSLTKGLRDFEYAFYNDIKTPGLLFDKALVIKKSVLTINSNMEQIKPSSKPQPLGFEVEPNYDVINKHKDRLLEYIVGEEPLSKINLEPIVQSKSLKILANGSASIKLKNEWSEFAVIDLKIKRNVITSNTGKLLVYLIEQKKLNERPYKYSKDSIKKDLEFNDSDYNIAIDSIRSAIKKKLKETGETKKVRLYRERGTDHLVFANITQEETFFK